MLIATFWLKDVMVNSDFVVGVVAGKLPYSEVDAVAFNFDPAMGGLNAERYSGLGAFKGHRSVNVAVKGLQRRKGQIRRYGTKAISAAGNCQLISQLGQPFVKDVTPLKQPLLKGCIHLLANATIAGVPQRLGVFAGYLSNFVFRSLREETMSEFMDERVEVNLGLLPWIDLNQPLSRPSLPHGVFPFKLNLNNLDFGNPPTTFGSHEDSLPLNRRRVNIDVKAGC